MWAGFMKVVGSLNPARGTGAGLSYRAAGPSMRHRPSHGADPHLLAGRRVSAKLAGKYGSGEGRQRSRRCTFSHACRGPGPYAKGHTSCAVCPSALAASSTRAMQARVSARIAGDRPIARDASMFLPRARRRLRSASTVFAAACPPTKRRGPSSPD